MASSVSRPRPVWITRVPSGITGRSMLNLVNLLLRETVHRLTVLQRGAGPDPEIYVVTRVEWRDQNPERPMLPQIPRLLSLLEALRGTHGVPHEIYLDQLDGLAVYLPTGVHLSQLPNNSRESSQFLISLVVKTVTHLYATMREVEEWFWRAARQKGFSPEIVERIARGEPHFDTPAHRFRFQELLHSYFSIRFRIHSSESCLRVEGVR